MIRLFAAFATAVAALAGIWMGPSDIELAEAPLLSSPVYGERVLSTTTTTLVPADALCGEWWVTATVAGWGVDDLPTLDRVIYNESRCLNGLISGTNDVGLAQLNVRVHSYLWERDGWSTDQVRASPVLNLWYARRVADLAVSYGWCEWEPWDGYSGVYC